jgi:RNA polymerase sigma-70 factor, ECF subfamily
MMRQGSMDVLGTLIPGQDVLSGESWQPAQRGNIHKMDHTDQPRKVLSALRAQERELATLIAQLIEGDQTALATLYDRTNSLVYSLALRIVQDHSAAEDVTIEVYTQVYRQASSYNAKRGSPSAWLHTLTRSRAIDRLRVETPRRERETPFEEPTAIAALATSPEEERTTSKLREIVQRALATLTPEQREVIENAYDMGLSHSEIAARLGQPLGTVKTRMRTGMLLLRARLHPLWMEAHS